MLVKLKKILTAGVKSTEYLKEIDQSAKIFLYNELQNQIKQNNPESIIAHGYKVFSQVDEDGIIENIFKNISVRNKLFVEIGCGNGLENNTHYLAIKGWRGVWVDGSLENINFIKSKIKDTKDKLVISQNIITPENVIETITLLVNRLSMGTLQIDLLSLDIDGYDFEVLEQAITLKPRVVCVEYNPEFRPPLSLSVKRGHYKSWDTTMYHGASLQSLYEMMTLKNYALVSCSLSGYNAFFVHKDELGPLTPKLPDEVYQPPREFLVGVRFGHKKSFGFLNQILSS